MNIIELAHVASTIALTSLIYVVQLVHYPSFYYIDKAKFVRFEKFHQARISIIVMPLMLIELAACILLLISDVSPLNIFLMVLTLITWLSTYFLSMPLHAKLSSGYDDSLIKKLIKTNWPRTISWSLKTILIGVSFA